MYLANPFNPASALCCSGSPNTLHPKSFLVSLGFLLSLTSVFAACAIDASACPFCSALANTTSDDLAESTVGVVARYEEISVEEDGIRICRLRISDVIKGDPSLNDSIVEVTTTKEFFDKEHTADSVFWLLGFGEEKIEWAPAVQISPEGVSYLKGLNSIPKSGAKRLEFFLGYLKHEDKFVHTDAYNEFAEASMEDISRLSSKLDRQWVKGQLRDASVPRHRRRLCWTFLSQCGTVEDVHLFDELLAKRRVDHTFDPGMDAAISCFISLGGERALARIEADYLANPNADYLDCFAAVSAIRVHGTELNLIPRARLAKALRFLLNRPELADLVISDLARWKDWSVIDRIVELFEKSTEETSFLKPAAVRYLTACPLPAATEALKRLREIDSKAVELAEMSMKFYSGLAALPVPPPDEQTNGGEVPSAPRIAENQETVRE